MIKQDIIPALLEWFRLIDEILPSEQLKEGTIKSMIKKWRLSKRKRIRKKQLKKINQRPSLAWILLTLAFAVPLMKSINSLKNKHD